VNTEVTGDSDGQGGVPHILALPALFTTKNQSWKDCGLGEGWRSLLNRRSGAVKGRARVGRTSGHRDNLLGLTPRE